MQNWVEMFGGDPAALYIETCSGRKLHLARPSFDIDEIAHALSNSCRFAGHCATFYSVAEHSVLVACIMDVMGWGDPLEGLLHDGTESVLPDIPAPVKGLLPDYRRVEQQLEVALRTQFGLPVGMTDGAKRADWCALYLEASLLMPTGGRDWAYPEGIAEDTDRAAALLYQRAVTAGNIAAGEPIAFGAHPDRAREAFLVAFQGYVARRVGL